MFYYFSGYSWLLLWFCLLLLLLYNYGAVFHLYATYQFLKIIYSIYFIKFINNTQFWTGNRLKKKTGNNLLRSMLPFFLHASHYFVKTIKLNTYFILHKDTRATGVNKCYYNKTMVTFIIKGSNKLSPFQTTEYTCYQYCKT